MKLSMRFERATTELLLRYIPADPSRQTRLTYFFEKFDFTILGQTKIQISGKIEIQLQGQKYDENHSRALFGAFCQNNTFLHVLAKST